jgi:Na+/H+-dicarboxylate symporter
MRQFGLIPRILTAILLGSIVGSLAPSWFIRVFSSLNHLFDNFLGFVIPLIIIGFIAPGIGSMGRGAGKLLGITAGLAYGSTILAGFIAYIVSSSLLPILLEGQASHSLSLSESTLVAAYFSVKIEPLMSVMTALILSFVLGVGVSITEGNVLLQLLKEFHTIVEKIIQVIILPVLPLYIFGSFSKMAYGGQVVPVLSVFLKVFIMIILLHLSYIFIQYSIAGAINRKNPLSMLREMLPVYLGALGTQSSAAVIPITLKQTKNF